MQQHIMQRHSHYTTAAYHAAALSAKHVTTAYHATTLSAKHVTAAYHAVQHSQSFNGSISCSSILSVIALSHYEFWLILLLPALYVPESTICDP